MIRVSDHALVCFLQRAGGLDVEQLRSSIEAALGRASAAAESIGGGDYSIRVDGLSFIVRAGTVTTVLPDLAEGSRFRALEPREP